MRQAEGSLFLNLRGNPAEQHAVYPGTAQAATWHGGAGALPARASLPAATSTAQAGTHAGGRKPRSHLGKFPGLLCFARNDALEESPREYNSHLQGETLKIHSQSLTLSTI